MAALFFTLKMEIYLLCSQKLHLFLCFILYLCLQWSPDLPCHPGPQVSCLLTGHLMNASSHIKIYISKTWPFLFFIKTLLSFFFDAYYMLMRLFFFTSPLISFLVSYSHNRPSFLWVTLYGISHTHLLWSFLLCLTHVTLKFSSNWLPCLALVYPTYCC